VPGTAASSGGGAATLGYDEQVRLTPLTVGFHETQFLSVVGEENREIAAKGFWFQRSGREQARSKYQWGPSNPQALNRYTYCLGNPLRYVDPTGHDGRIVIFLTQWGPLTQTEAEERNTTNEAITDASIGLFFLGLSTIVGGKAGFGLGVSSIVLATAINVELLREGDYGYRSLSYDTNEDKYIYVEYTFREDGRVLYHVRMESTDGVYWVTVVEMVDWTRPDEEGEQ
jgi:hypothetical protein